VQSSHGVRSDDRRALMHCLTDCLSPQPTYLVTFITMPLVGLDAMQHNIDTAVVTETVFDVPDADMYLVARLESKVRGYESRTWMEMYNVEDHYAEQLA